MPSKWGEMLDNTNVVLCFLKTTQHTKAQEHSTFMYVDISTSIQNTITLNSQVFWLDYMTTGSATLCNCSRWIDGSRQQNWHFHIIARYGPVTLSDNNEWCTEFKSAATLGGSDQVSFAIPLRCKSIMRLFPPRCKSILRWWVYII